MDICFERKGWTKICIHSQRGSVAETEPGITESGKIKDLENRVERSLGRQKTLSPGRPSPALDDNVNYTRGGRAILR